MLVHYLLAMTKGTGTLNMRESTHLLTASRSHIPAAALSAQGPPAWEDLQSWWGVSPSVFRVEGNTGVSPVNCRVTHVCD